MADSIMYTSQSNGSDKIRARRHHLFKFSETILVVFITRTHIKKLPELQSSPSNSRTCV